MRKLAAILILVQFVYACSDNKASGETQTVSHADHEHTFSCPMHPEVTGKEGDKCPKCGMKLEHTDVPATSTVGYYMQVAMNPTTVEPNKNVTLSFTPKIKGKDNEQVPLDVEHEKKIHLILVSDDLSWFDHIHPEYQADGTYTVAARFPAPGKYKAFADYKPTGATHVVDKIDIDVTGTGAAPKQFSADKWSGSSGNYSFELRPQSGDIITGTMMHILGIVRKDGKEIDANSLENYLGAKAHFVVISLSEKEYLHVHPSVENGQFDLHTTFDKPGLYRGWVQFNADGKLHTIDFTLNVKQGDAEAIRKASAGHGDQGGASADHEGH